MLIRLTPNASMASISCMTNPQTEDKEVTEPKRRPRNAVLV